jgi:dynactin complex subunit
MCPICLAAERDDLMKANALLHALIGNREAEIERLRAALKEIKKTSIDEWEFQEGRVVAKVHMIAGAALEQKSP